MNRRMLYGAAVIAVFLPAAAACASSTPPIVSHGTIQVSINEAQNIGNPGSAINPFNNGGVVQVIASDGKVLAAAPVNAAAKPGEDQGSTAILNYVFTVQVPSGQPSYGLRLTNVPGTVWETPGQMSDPALSVTVGS